MEDAAPRAVLRHFSFSTAAVNLSWLMYTDTHIHLQAEFTGLIRQDDSKVSLTLTAKPAAAPKETVGFQSCCGNLQSKVGRRCVYQTRPLICISSQPAGAQVDQEKMAAGAAEDIDASLVNKKAFEAFGVPVENAACVWIGAAWALKMRARSHMCVLAHCHTLTPCRKRKEPESAKRKLSNLELIRLVGEILEAGSVAGFTCFWGSPNSSCHLLPSPFRPCRAITGK